MSKATCVAIMAHWLVAFTLRALVHRLARYGQWVSLAPRVLQVTMLKECSFGNKVQADIGVVLRMKECCCLAADPVPF